MIYFTCSTSTIIKKLGIFSSLIIHIFGLGYAKLMNKNLILYANNFELASVKYKQRKGK